MEVLLNVQPYPQPQPTRNSGGDCFTCSLVAALRHLFPDRSPSFDQVYDLFLRDRKEFSGASWIAMRQALWAAHGEGCRMEITADLVEPRWDPETWDHNWWQNYPSLRYAYRLEGWLRGGWLALVVIDYEGRGPVLPIGKFNVGNHWVLLDGIRAVWEPISDLGRALTHYVHVICSVRGAYWIKLDHLLWRYGAAAWLLCRRDER